MPAGSSGHQPATNSVTAIRETGSIGNSRRCNPRESRVFRNVTRENANGIERSINITVATVPGNLNRLKNRRSTRARYYTARCTIVLESTQSICWLYALGLQRRHPCGQCQKHGVACSSGTLFAGLRWRPHRIIGAEWFGEVRIHISQIVSHEHPEDVRAHAVKVVETIPAIKSLTP